MVELRTEQGELVVRLRGFSRVLALKSGFRIPLASITGLGLDPQAARGFWKGIRFPGTHVPGFLVAGTFFREGRKNFWSVRRGRTAVVIDLENAPYRRLILEVRDPDAAVRMIEEARAQA